jgi:hypothetical protein
MVKTETHTARTARFRRGGSALAALLAVALAVALGGSWLNSRAFGQLLTQIESGEITLTHYNADAGRLARDFAPSTATPSEFTALAARYKEIAAGTLQDVLVHEQQVQDVRLWPWDRDAVKARQRYIDHLAAWELELRAVSRGDPDSASASADINATFILLNTALADAIPLYERDYRARVADIGDD